MFGHLSPYKISEGRVNFKQDQYLIDCTSFACRTPIKIGKLIEVIANLITSSRMKTNSLFPTSLLTHSPYTYQWPIDNGVIKGAMAYYKELIWIVILALERLFTLLNKLDMFQCMAKIFCI